MLLIPWFKTPDLSNIPSRKLATLQQATGSYINTGIVIAQGLLLIPLYLYYIGAHTYGIWLASGGMLGILGLVNFGIGSLIIQRISRSYACQDMAKVVAYFVNGSLIYLGIILIYALVGWTASIWISTILNVTGEEAELLKNCFQVAVLAMVLGIFNECMRSFAQALLRPIIPMLGMAVGRVLGIGVTVWMLFYNFGLWAIPAGLLVAEGVIFIFNVLYTFLLLRKLTERMSFDKCILREYLQTSPALLMSRMGDTLSQESEPLLITIFLSPEVTTAYMVTRRAADIVFRMLNVIVGSTMGPFSHLAGSSDIEAIRKVVKKLFFISFSAGAIGLASYVGANHIFVPLWTGELFILDQNIVIFIALGFFARSLRGLLGQMLYGLGDFSYTSIVVLLEGVIRIAMSLGLLSIFGIIGVPLAFVLSCLVAMLVLAVRLKNKLMMDFNLSVIIRFLFSGSVLFGIAMVLPQMELSVDSWSGFVLYLLTLLASVITTYMLMNWTRCCNIYRSIVK